VSTTPALEARGLEKSYGPLPAVRGIDFALEPGSFLVVFGPNGAGKTTLLRLLCGAVQPTAGEVRIAGETIGGGTDAWRRRIGVLSHQTFLYGGLSARENLDFYARLYGLAPRDAIVRRALEDVGLAARAADPVKTFSRGMKQRLALARTLLHDPGVVLLDEPFTGLDPHAAAMLRGVLERLRDGRRTVVLVTHDLVQGLELADRVVVQVAGRWVSDEPRSAVDPGAFEHLYGSRVAGVL
jgi:heme exporter protein A